MRQVRLGCAVFLLIVGILGGVPLASSQVNLTIVNSPKFTIRQGVADNIYIYVANMADPAKDNAFVTISGPIIRTLDGELTPAEWWEIEVSPSLENFWVEWEQVQANFYLPCLSPENEIPEVYPENIDSYIELSSGSFLGARRVTITIKALEEVPRGEYELEVSFTAESLEKVESGLGAAVTLSASPRLVVKAPPPAQTTPPTTPLPVWATIFLIVAFAGLAVGLVWAIRKGKI